MAAQREPKAGRRPGNQDTRGKIITAARHAFAAKGFAGASMRAIAAEARVDAALIHHYFDSKQQLFLATVRSRSGCRDIARAGRRGRERRARRAARPDRPGGLGFRAAAVADRGDPDRADRSGHDPLGQRVPHPRSHRPGPAARRSPTRGSERRAGLVASQILGLVMGRYVLRLPALVAQSSESLVAAVGPTLQRYLRRRDCPRVPSTLGSDRTTPPLVRREAAPTRLLSVLRFAIADVSRNGAVMAHGARSSGDH